MDGLATMPETEVGTVKTNTQIVEAADVNPMTLLSKLDLNNVNTDAMEKLMDLQERWEANNAKRAYAEAVAAFQAEMPPISKKREGRSYVYAAFDDIMKVAAPILQKHGLSVSFPQESTEEETRITCRVMHVGGHSEDTPYTTQKSKPLQTRDGRNIINLEQAGGSSNSYAKRYCFCNALNIVVTDEDDDAISARYEEPTPALQPANQVEFDRELATQKIAQQIEEAGLDDSQVNAAVGELLKKEVTDWLDLPENVIKHLCTPQGWEKMINILKK